MPPRFGEVIKQARQARRLADQVSKEDGRPISPQDLFIESTIASLRLMSSASWRGCWTLMMTRCWPPPAGPIWSFRNTSSAVLRLERRSQALSGGAAAGVPRLGSAVPAHARSGEGGSSRCAEGRRIDAWDDRPTFQGSAADVIRQLIAQGRPEDFAEHWQLGLGEPRQGGVKRGQGR
jgi:hypothetical protein